MWYLFGSGGVSTRGDDAGGWRGQGVWEARARFACAEKVGTERRQRGWNRPSPWHHWPGAGVVAAVRVSSQRCHFLLPGNLTSSSVEGGSSAAQALARFPSFMRVNTLETSSDW